MKNIEWNKIAQTITKHSLQIQKHQRILISALGNCEPLIIELISEIRKVGAEPVVRCKTVGELKMHIKACINDEHFKSWADREMQDLHDIDGYIGIRSDENIYELEDLPQHQYSQYLSMVLQPQQFAMAALNKWVLLKYPTSGMAQLAKISNDAMAELYEKTICLDYDLLAERAHALGRVLKDTDKVRIIAPGTDLSFSIKSIPYAVGDGRYNLPDGEVFTAPIIDSVEGTIRFNTPSMFMGVTFEHVQLTFQHGRVVEAAGSNEEQLNTFILMDEGSSRVGEFGIGLNPYIQVPTQHILFDEKMIGSVHFALGQSYPHTYNGNESSIHWDLVLCMSERYGGGEMYFDDRLVFKNGRYIISELEWIDEVT